MLEDTSLVFETERLVLLLVRVQQHTSSIFLYSHKVCLRGSRIRTPQFGPCFHIELVNARADCFNHHIFLAQRCYPTLPRPFSIGQVTGHETVLIFKFWHHVRQLHITLFSKLSGSHMRTQVFRYVERSCALLKRRHPL